MFFIVDRGAPDIYIGGLKKKSLGRGDGFGELALLYNAPRSASVKCEQDCHFWAIDRKTFKNVGRAHQIVKSVSKKQFKEHRSFLNEIRFFESMTDSQKDSIASSLILQNFKQGDLIISEGDLAASYYIIKNVVAHHQGSAECVKDGAVIRKLQAGDSFGEQALYESGVRSLSVRAGQDCVCLGLSRDSLQEILGAQIQEVIEGNWSRWAVEKNPVFSRLTKLQVERWIQNGETRSLQAGQQLGDKGQPLKEILIVINGELKYGDKAYARGSVFDEKFLYPNKSLKGR